MEGSIYDMKLLLIKKFWALVMLGHKKNELLEIMEVMVTARTLDLELQKLWRNKMISRSLLSGIGGEAGPAVITSLMHTEDILIPHYRGYAYMVGKGLSLEKIVAEMLGKVTGTNKGIGGYGKFTDLELNIYAHSEVAGSDFVMAFAIKMRREDKVVVVFLGDGTTTRTTFFSTLNLAALWKVPVLFVCENNQYSISQLFSESSITSLKEKVNASGVYYNEIDGNDPLLIYPVAKSLLAYVRKQSSPAFLELSTYRVTGHNLADRGTYQDNAEKKKWEKRDPIRIFSETLIRFRIGTKQDLSAITKRAEIHVNVALNKAQNDSEYESDSFLKGGIFTETCRN